MTNPTSPPDRYAVFGNPIAHSKSPMIHELFAQQTGENIEYTKQLVELGQFDVAAKKFFDEGGKGLNVTVPFKLDAFAFAEKNGSVSERAKLAGAVNTLKKMDDGKIFGDNTDGAGLVRDITQNLGWEIKGKNVLILGAGGAVRGVLAPLLEQKPQSIMIANSTMEKAVELRKLFQDFGKISVWDNSTVSPIDFTFDITINGSSADLNENAGNQYLQNLVLAVSHSESACAYNMSYGIYSAPFLDLAGMNGIQNRADGLGMLVEQAAESFYIWRGVRPETKPVIDKVRTLL